MNDTPTEAHIDLVESVRFSNDRSAALQIAESEARAVAAAFEALTCTQHSDKERAACPVCLLATLTAERNAARARAEKAGKQFRILKETLDHVTNMYDVAMARAERAEETLRLVRYSVKFNNF